jgi:tetratricopeptide (TPR) repeat protein
LKTTHPRHGVWKRAPRQAAGVVAALCAASAIAARPAGPPVFSIDEFTSRSIARLATIDLRMTVDPREADYRAATILLGLAQDLQPQDQEILRRRIESAWNAGDRDLALTLTEQLVRLDPADTVAQLRLVTSRVARIETVEGRLAAYERFLGPDGRSIDPAIRSRLALDAALLLRERGDEEGFVEKLTLSAQLDPTHKEAAAFAATYASSRVDRTGRLDLLVNLLKADPLDPNIHRSLASEFAAAGAFGPARRFLGNARQILNVSGLPTEGLEREEKVLLWLESGPKALVERINAERVVRMDAAAKRLALAQGTGSPTQGLERPEDVRVSVPDAMMQILALDASGDRAAVEAAVGEMADTVNRVGSILLDPLKRPLDLPQAQAEAQLAGVSTQLQVARLWTGVQVDGAREALAPGGALTTITPEAVKVLNSWLKLRSGDPQGAIDELTGLAETEPSARAGIGMGLEMLGRVPEAVEQYKTLVRDATLTTAGAWAASRLKAMGTEPSADETKAAVAQAATVPDWVDRLVQRPREFVTVSLSTDTPSVDAMDRVTLRLTITNTSPIPMALGADRPINSRLLLAPKLETPDILMPSLIRPEIVDADRRLRLLPRQSLTIDLWPDPGETGLLAELMAFRNTRLRWRLIQGFWIESGGGYRPGPMCVTTETSSVIRRPLPDASFSPESYAVKFKGDPEELLPRAASALRSVLLNRPIEPARAGDPAPTDAPAAAVADAIVARYPSLSPTSRAMIAVVVPHQRLAPSMKAVDDAVRGDSDPVVMCLALVTRVTAADDELLKRASEFGDERVRDLAAQVSGRLGAGNNLYSTWTPQLLRKKPAGEKEPAK